MRILKHSSPCILEIDSKRAYADGVVFYHGNEKVWPADIIPACYIKEL